MRRAPLLLVMLVGISTIAACAAAPPGSKATSHSPYPLGHAHDCRAHYTKQIRVHKVHGEKVRYVACVWGEKGPGLTTTTTPPGPGFVAGRVTAIGDSVLLDAKPDLVADIPGVDIEAAVSRQWVSGIALVQRLKAEDQLGAVVVVDLGTNGPISVGQFRAMMDVLAGASLVVLLTVHLPASYSWANSVNAVIEAEVPRYRNARLADFNALADRHPQWFGPDGVHMPIGGTGAKAMAQLIATTIDS